MSIFKIFWNRCFFLCSWTAMLTLAHIFLYIHLIQPIKYYIPCVTVAIGIRSDQNVSIQQQSAIFCLTFEIFDSERIQVKIKPHTAKNVYTSRERERKIGKYFLYIFLSVSYEMLIFCAKCNHVKYQSHCKVVLELFDIVVVDFFVFPQLLFRFAFD